MFLAEIGQDEPGLLGEVDRRVFGEDETDVDGFQAVEAYLPYVREQLGRGVHLAAMTRHMLGLFHGRHGARAWRRILTVESVKPGADEGVIHRALAAVAEGAARAA